MQKPSRKGGRWGNFYLKRQPEKLEEQMREEKLKKKLIYFYWPMDEIVVDNPLGNQIHFEKKNLK